MWGWNTVLTYDQQEAIELVTKHTQVYYHYFTSFRKTLLEIYNDLVQKVVLSSIQDDDEALDPIGIEIWKPCAYHDAIYHSIRMFIRFCYDLEALVNMGKIRVEFSPRG